MPTIATAAQFRSCATEFICLDCGVQFALKKLIQAYVAMGLGAVAGLMIGGQAGALWALPAAVVYAYVFASIFFGWHYGDQIWVKLGKFADRFTGATGMFAGLMLLSVRITA